MRNLCVLIALSVLPMAAQPARAQAATEVLPELISHADAIYPAIAHTAHVSGDVVVEITTDGQSVVEAHAESGPALLQSAAVDNAKTWKFAPHTAGSFHVTYHYDLVSGDPDTTAVTSFPNSSDNVDVKVVALPKTLMIDYAWATLGTWTCQFRSPHGALSKKFEFRFSGPNEAWLDVRVPGAEEDNPIGDGEFSRKDGDFLIFSMKISQPDGKILRTFFTGKMSGQKIVGTSVDESGVRGTWTATRIPGSEMK